MRIVDYTVVEEYSLNEFIKRIKELIYGGWKPIGGIIMRDGFYVQAMIYEEE